MFNRWRLRESSFVGRVPRDDQQNDLYAALVEEQETKERIRRSLECPICTDILLDPIILECGHTFCLHCFAHDCDRRNSATLVCCLCRDNTSSKSRCSNYQT